MNTTNCKLFKENLLQDLVEGNTLFLSQQLNQHKDICAECLLFYNNISAQNDYLQLEKKTEINPYLVNKILLKVSAQKNNTIYKPSFVQSSVSFIAVVLISVLVGVGFNNFLYPAEGESIESETVVSAASLTEATDEPVSPLPANEAAINTDNDILTLND